MQKVRKLFQVVLLLQAAIALSAIGYASPNAALERYRSLGEAVRTDIERGSVMRAAWNSLQLSLSLAGKLPAELSEKINEGDTGPSQEVNNPEFTAALVPVIDAVLQAMNNDDFPLAQKRADELAQEAHALHARYRRLQVAQLKGNDLWSKNSATQSIHNALKKGDVKEARKVLFILLTAYSLECILLKDALGG